MMEERINEENNVTRKTEQNEGMNYENEGQK